MTTKQSKSIQAVREWLEEVFIMERDEGCGHWEHGELLEEAGFEPDDEAGQWLGPDGSGLDGVDFPGTEMKRAFDLWLSGGETPSSGIRDALDNVTHSRGLQAIDFTQSP